MIPQQQDISKYNLVETETSKNSALLFTPDEISKLGRGEVGASQKYFYDK